MDDVERAYREAHGQAVATLARLFGDITLAEDAVQDAFVTAMDRWPRDGVPDNPAGWIVTTARNRAVDVVRRNRRGRELAEGIASDRLRAGTTADSEMTEPMRDDQLRLVFTCCHPAIRVEHQVALTLRLIAGLTPSEVASAFLVSEETMAKRLVRAKYKIKAAHIPYRVPDDAELPGRLRVVLSVLYLVYNAGADDLNRRDLRAEAIRLTRRLVDLMPAEPEAVGLLALMLLSDARVPARGGDGDVVLLKDQDRSLWDRSLIAEGQALVLACLRRRRLGPFQLQAAIQALHCAAGRYEDTNWTSIVRFYDRLIAVMPTPVVALNRAVAVAETQGPDRGLLLIEEIAGDLSNYYPLHAARGSMLQRLGRREEAAKAYARAAELASTESATRFLRGQAELVERGQDRTK
ncbi:RNA polymerase sigma-70 factor (ECF subfamily) [Kribbella steppae]|uniref:RNA polymerase sigma-70 factor (ECF subfamily) n=1 Tax=Kribbella steppae TaxID=2512223 RepID=A0A4R2H7C1_9ACTN|nr:sigma-70 family RNA polymerase sigma factor [Kribbella steppae]TCO20345.1 RNA polymerase sigma-70 factor (ECF subfamily) [Kribbella steppae]